MATAGPVNRTLLQSFYQNAGDVYDDTKTEGAFGTLADQLDANYDYTSGLVAGGVLQPYPAFLSRQALINGNFDVWQRGTSFILAINNYTADQWFSNIGATSAIGTISRQPFTVGQSIVPNNPKYFVRINPTTLTGCTSFGFENRIEGVDKFAGQMVTFSFWAKSDITQTISTYMRQNFGTGGSPSAAAVTTGANIALTTTWTRYSVTFAIPSISSKTLGSNADDYLAFGLNLPLTGTYSIDISQSQVNAGNQALPFQPKSYNQENIDSLRYRWQSWADSVISPSIGTLSGYALTTSALIVNGRFPIPMRISPTLSIQNNNVSNQVRNSSTGAVVAATFNFANVLSNKGFSILSFTGTPFTVGQYYDFDIIADSGL